MARPRIFSGIQPTGRSTSATTSARSASTSRARTAARRSTASSTCTRSPCRSTRPSCARRSTTPPRSCSPPGSTPSAASSSARATSREHTELTWLLSSVTAWGDLNRMHQWKEKRELLESARARSSPPALFNYPVLQAADVLAYRANEVPVGDDQRQHIELMREIARRFNERFGETLVVPEHRIPEVGARIMDLQDPTSKMSTTGGTEQGTVLVLDEPDAVRKKVRSAVTDSGSEVRRGEGKEGIANLIEILSVVRGASMEDDRARVRGLGLRRLQGRRRGGGRRVPGAGARALRRAARRRGRARGGPRRRRREGARDRRPDPRRRARGDGRRARRASAAPRRRARRAPRARS